MSGYEEDLEKSDSDMSLPKNEEDYEEDVEDEEYVHEDGRDGEEDELDIPSKRPRFDSTSENNSDDGINHETTNTNQLSPTSNEVSSEARYGSTNIGLRIMKKYGLQPGKGLGKHEQGIIEPVEASKQKGTRGFGYHAPVSVNERVMNCEAEQIFVNETVEWIENTYPEIEMPQRNVLDKWLRKGPQKHTIDDECHFCDPDILEKILTAKAALNDVDDTVLKKSRSLGNPFETIGKGIFLNRAAMKMANMDYVFDYMFTKPKNKQGKEIIGPNDLLYFADVCAGPGGFSEYIFFRKKWKAKGFGFTLRDKNDFRLDDFYAGPCETFEPHYGVSVDSDIGNGDIFQPDNIESFTSFVLKNTGVGVHFMMADGGFSTQEKSIQEVVSKQLYLCQCLVALKIVRTGGHFVVKLFDIFTPFSVGLVYLMYRCFDRISLHKPNTSRPANSERYLICQYKRSNCRDVADYLFDVNKILCHRVATNVDVLELVPSAILEDTKNFFDYIVKTNNRIGKRQVYHLENIRYYASHTEMSDPRQETLRVQCLKLWDVPMGARMDPTKGDAKSKIAELLGNDSSQTNFLYQAAADVTNLEEFIKMKETEEWYFTVIENEPRQNKLTFYLGLGRSNVFRLEGQSWIKLDDKNFQLPAGTLVYGEFVQEYVHHSNDVRGQYRVNAFHIVDGLFLGKEDIRKKHIVHRRECCELFAKALCHSNMLYRVKKLYELSTWKEVQSSVRPRTLKTKKTVLGFNIEEGRFFVPKGLLLFYASNEEWKFHFSKKFKTYFYDNTKEKVWQRWVLYPDGLCKVRQELYQSICSEFKTCFRNRFVWWFSERDLIK